MQCIRHRDSHAGTLHLHALNQTSAFDGPGSSAPAKMSCSVALLPGATARDVVASVTHAGGCMGRCAAKTRFITADPASPPPWAADNCGAPSGAAAGSGPLPEVNPRLRQRSSRRSSRRCGRGARFWARGPRRVPRSSGSAEPDARARSTSSRAAPEMPMGVACGGAPCADPSATPAPPDPDPSPTPCSTRRETHDASPAPPRKRSPAKAGSSPAGSPISSKPLRRPSTAGTGSRTDALATGSPARREAKGSGSGFTRGASSAKVGARARTPARAAAGGAASDPDPCPAPDPGSSASASAAPASQSSAPPASGATSRRFHAALPAVPSANTYQATAACGTCRSLRHCRHRLPHPFLGMARAGICGHTVDIRNQNLQETTA